MTLKTIRPSSSYLIELPKEIRDRIDGRVSSFWRDGEPLLLQLSSHIRNEGTQVCARMRLEERMAKFSEKWSVRDEHVGPGDLADQVAGEFLDENGVWGFHMYLVWPHLSIHATISGPEKEVRNPDTWAMTSLKSITLAIQ